MKHLDGRQRQRINTGLAGILLLLCEIPCSANSSPRFEEGLKLYRENQLQLALVEFDASEKAGEHKPTRTFYQGICLAKLGEWGQASDRFVAYVAAQPSDPTGWYWLSRTQLFRRQFSEASTSIERAIHLAPNSYEAFRTKGEIQLELRNNQAAYEAWIAANKLNPGDAQTTYYLGRLFYEADFPKEAASWLQETLRLAPTHFSAMTYLALCTEQLPDSDSALRLYREAIKQSKLQKAPFAWAYLSYAKLLRQMGNDGESFAVLEEGERLAPNARSLALLGQLLMERKQLTRAESVLRRAIGMEPGIPDAHYRLSLLLKSTGRSAEAQDEMTRFKQAKEVEDRNRNKISAIRK